MTSLLSKILYLTVGIHYRQTSLCWNIFRAEMLYKYNVHICQTIIPGSPEFAHPAALTFWKRPNPPPAKLENCQYGQQRRLAELFFSSEKITPKLKGRRSTASEDAGLRGGHHCSYRSAFTLNVNTTMQKIQFVLFTQRWLTIKLYDRLSNWSSEDMRGRLSGVEKNSP
jgi:hypothetical protein